MGEGENNSPGHWELIEEVRREKKAKGERYMHFIEGGGGKDGRYEMYWTESEENGGLIKDKEGKPK